MYRIVQRKDRSADEKRAEEEQQQQRQTPQPQQPIRIATPPQRKVVAIERRVPPTVSAAATDAIKAELGRSGAAAAESTAQSSNKLVVKKPEPEPAKEKHEMDASIRLIDDELELLDSLKEFLIETNPKYSVIGAIGAQGTGKSTVLSMLAGNSPSDMYRQYIFRPAAREVVEACRYQTQKIYVYVNHKIRAIFLDCQPLNCLPLLEDQTRSYRSKGLLPLETMELESIQLLLLLANVCQTLILCIDWFIDLSIVRRLMRTELFPSFLPHSDEQSVNLVLLHQRAHSEDFQPLLVRDRMRILNGIFEDSYFNVNGGLTMAKLGFATYDNVCDGLDVNYVVLGELKPRTRTDGQQHHVDQINRWQREDYGAVMTQLREKIYQLPNSRRMRGLTEGQWFSNLASTWKRIREELPLLTEDGCTLISRRRGHHPNVAEHPLTPGSASRNIVGAEYRRIRRRGGGGGRRRGGSGEEQSPPPVEAEEDIEAAQGEEQDEGEPSAEVGEHPIKKSGVWRMGGQPRRFIRGGGESPQRQPREWKRGGGGGRRRRRRQNQRSGSAEVPQPPCSPPPPPAEWGREHD